MLTNIKTGKIVILIYSQLKGIHQSKYLSDKIVSAAAKSCFLDDQVLTTKHTHTQNPRSPLTAVSYRFPSLPSNIIIQAYKPQTAF